MQTCSTCRRSARLRVARFNTKRRAWFERVLWLGWGGARVRQSLFMTKYCLRLLFLAAAALPLAHGCSDSSIECLGTPVACGNREIGQCTDGCRVFEGCVGDVVTCESLTDRPEICIQTEGCRYLGTCEGREGCENVGFDECGETPGCVQVRRCDGRDFSCPDLEASQCELYPQCRLGTECQGTATSCGDLGSVDECSSVPGCFSADTDPAILD